MGGPLGIGLETDEIVGEPEFGIGSRLGGTVRTVGDGGVVWPSFASLTITVTVCVSLSPPASVPVTMMVNGPGFVSKSGAVLKLTTPAALIVNNPASAPLNV